MVEVDEPSTLLTKQNCKNHGVGYVYTLLADASQTVDVCVREPIMDPVLDVCVREPIVALHVVWTRSLVSTRQHLSSRGSIRGTIRGSIGGP